MRVMRIGIDAGGTLIKIAYLENDRLVLQKFPVQKLDRAASWVNGLAEAEICITGGKGMLLKTLLTRSASEIVEFEATYRGVKYLLAEYGIPEKSFMLTNVGTGTSIHHINDDKHQRIGGTGVGGGTLLGLSQLLAGISNYEEIVQLAKKGTRDGIDLKVSHIYEGSKPPIPGDLTASNFGNLLNRISDVPPTTEDLLATVVGLVGETVATVSVLAAGQCGESSIVFIGSSFIGNDLLKEVVQGYTRLRGAEPMFVANGEYCGAIGALLQAGDQIDDPHSSSL